VFFFLSLVLVHSPVYDLEMFGSRLGGTLHIFPHVFTQWRKTIIRNPSRILTCEMIKFGDEYCGPEVRNAMEFLVGEYICCSITDTNLLNCGRIATLHAGLTRSCQVISIFVFPTHNVRSTFFTFKKDSERRPLMIPLIINNY
jgi:hypothetical protein